MGRLAVAARGVQSFYIQRRVVSRGNCRRFERTHIGMHKPYFMHILPILGSAVD